MEKNFSMDPDRGWRRKEEEVGEEEEGRWMESKQAQGG